jgi:hypothetical protein
MYALIAAALLSEVEVLSLQASEGKSRTELNEQAMAPVQTQSVASVQADGSVKVDCTHTDHHPDEHIATLKAKEPN